MATISNAQLLETINNFQTELGGKVDAIATKTNELHTCFSVMTMTVELNSLNVQENTRALRGSNGDTGLISVVSSIAKRMERLEVADQNCGIREVKNTLYGDSKDPGLLERVRDLEDLAKSIKKWVYLAGSAVVLGIISMLFDVIPKIMMIINSGPGG